MLPALWLVKGAYTDAIGAVCAAGTPPLITLLWVNHPFEDAGIVGYRRRLRGLFSKGDGTRGTIVGTFHTDAAKLFYSEKGGLIR